MKNLSVVVCVLYAILAPALAGICWYFFSKFDRRKVKKSNAKIKTVLSTFLGPLFFIIILSVSVMLYFLGNYENNNFPAVFLLAFLISILVNYYFYQDKVKFIQDQLEVGNWVIIKDSHYIRKNYLKRIKELFYDRKYPWILYDRDLVECGNKETRVMGTLKLERNIFFLLKIKGIIYPCPGHWLERVDKKEL